MVLCSILFAWGLCVRWGMRRSAAVPIRIGASCGAPFSCVSVVCVVVVGVFGKSFCVGSCGKYLGGRVGAFVCERKVGIESSEPGGPGAARGVSYPRFARGNLYAWGVE